VLIAKLEAHIVANQLLPTGEKLLLAVSGGNDSMALLVSFQQLAKRFAWQLTVVHVNHHLRGEESDQDANYVATYCQQQQIPCAIKHVDVRSAKAKSGGNKQALARQLRYQAFREVAEELQIRYLVVAHHADDQVETIIMRMLRGTGTQGLAGMDDKRCWDGLTIVRPLLPFTRVELETFVKENNMIPRNDSSNQSLAYTRNRLRLQLIPELKKYNPQLNQAILQLADVIREEEIVWDEWTKRVIDSCVRKMDVHTYEFDLPSFLCQPLALQRRVVKLILKCLMDENPPYQAVEQVVQLGLNPSPSVWIVLPGGIKGVRSYDLLRLTRDYIHRKTAQWHYPLPVPSKLQLPQHSMLEAVLVNALPAVPFEDTNVAVFDADQLPLEHLAVRNRRPGDSMQPFGFAGHKRVKALMMEHKIPRNQREFQPIVVADDQIIWLAGIRRAAIAPVSEQTRRYLVLRWNKVVPEQ
jgi:tRNA(Ile)-lysidine synthase